MLIEDGEYSLQKPKMRLALYRKLIEFLGANLGAAVPPQERPKAP